MALRILIVLVFLGLRSGDLLGEVPPADPRGLLVEGVGSGSAAETAGILPGDILRFWARAGEAGGGAAGTGVILRTPVDLNDVEVEWAQRGEVVLVGERNGEPCRWTLASSDFRLRTRPLLPPAVEELFAQGRALAEEANEPERGTALWLEGARRAEASGGTALAFWLLLKAGDVLADARKWEPALAVYSEAGAAAGRSGNPLLLARALNARGALHQKRNELAEAEACYREGLQLREWSRPGTLLHAASLTLLGNLLKNRGNLDAAEACHLSALVIASREALRSVTHAASLNNLGIVHVERGDAGEARRRFLESLELKRALHTPVGDLATSYGNLGNTAFLEGDWAESESMYREALAIWTQVAPRSRNVAMTRINLGNVAWGRGDFAAAEELYRSALSDFERLSPGSAAVGKILNNLGNIAFHRQDYEAAERDFRASMAIKERVVPGSLDVARGLVNLGNVAKKKGDLDVAEERYARALAIEEAHSPAGLDTALSLANLGSVASDRGNRGLAEEYVLTALAIYERKVPGSLEHALALFNVGSLARRRGDTERAEGYLSACEVIRGRLAPGSAFEAEVLHELGLVYWAAGKRGPARLHLCGAVEAIEAQRGRLGGSEEVRSGFTAGYADYFRDYIEFLAEEGDDAEAFAVLERSRARGLLDLLAERDLDFRRDAPVELLKEMTRLDKEYEEAQEALAVVPPDSGPEEAASRLGRLREVALQRRDHTERLKRASPKFASLRFPQSLDLEEVSRLLPSGMLLLSYSVGEEKTLLFELLDGRLRVRDLPVGRAELGRRVAAFRSLLADPESSRDRMERSAKDLYDILVVPAESALKACGVVLVCPDGPLHVLPFSALVDRRGHFLVEDRPVSYALSATVYHERGGERTKPCRVRLMAFGDPARGFAGAETTRAAPAWRNVGPLPASREEVARICGLFPGASQMLLGERANEREVKNLGPEVCWVHFACHGVLDPLFPLDSGLVLSEPAVGVGSDNGFIQAWEIFETVRLQAELVVLSACETGLGREVRGEGLAGLTRAFQYAGARSVLSSLWSVSDESSADLMGGFYRYLKEGRSKSEALRLAQVAMIRRSSYSKLDIQNSKSNWSHPFYWAAFILNGD